MRNALNEVEEENRQNQERFQARLPEDIYLVDPDIETEYLELLPNQRIADFVQENKGISGYYYPVRLNDTYGLLLDCSIDKGNEAQLVESFSLLKTTIEEKLQGEIASLGQTWMMSGWLPDVNPEPSEKIAQDCYRTLVNNANWQQDLQGKGTWFGGEIFELWRSHSLAQENWHVIIIIYPNQESAQKAAEFSPDWMGLLCYRHKIWWAYSQSRLLKKMLVEEYQQIEKAQRNIQSSSSQSINIQLARLQQSLANYGIDLPKLSFQKQIIEINLLNYQTRLQMMLKKADSEGELEFLQKFIEQAEQKYIIQITKDSENMQLGLRLLENTLNALRSQIELTKAERDQRFQTLITVIGSGTAGAALIDTSGTKCEAVLGKETFFCKNNFFKTVGFPISLILILGLLVLIGKKIFNKIMTNK